MLQKSGREKNVRFSREVSLSVSAIETRFSPTSFTNWRTPSSTISDDRIIFANVSTELFSEQPASSVRCHQMQQTVSYDWPLTQGIDVDSNKDPNQGTLFLNRCSAKIAEAR
jgi:hypothetical protein